MGKVNPELLGSEGAVAGFNRVNINQLIIAEGIDQNRISQQIDHLLLGHSRTDRIHLFRSQNIALLDIGLINKITAA